MLFSTYQQEAEKTDQTEARGADAMTGIMVPLLGLAGETGTLLTEYKKYLRDGTAYRIFNEKIAEELGDILWYVSTIATKQGLDLELIARSNIAKITDRWHENSSPLFGPKLFDDGRPENEQFPRQFDVVVSAVTDDDGKERILLSLNGNPLGDPVRDNTYEDDGYRLHDVFHLSYVAVLGWSPVMRKLFGRKRKSDPLLDENEDGGRAQVIDEAISALVFEEARKTSFFADVPSLDYELLRTIKGLTARLEVARCSGRQWETAILSGFDVWRALRERRSGTIRCDLIEGMIKLI
ncbi:nucleoside triphosphate pyrophosphohydrolase family protein [Burkholderia cepacia]|uniref:Nucleoside triphosphate pyrophosphohydrolase family protein n=1 Tax=Burkholderia cepacia TaxID=292 RepID=A0A8I1DKY6_BURCE|nr:nucleoside triphosphate pyrophosphohydrolase family protein [Burkholderia cepacia]MBA9900917.1 nucleotide pyrophosphohydrolase [Burkholderia cepacia]MBA9947882.1 nucleotide pyrophosphohydrolase [Burkholderia cepacia]MBA9978128.1 nucleotide pyrophosphohydrolase [Burkholderia cepacia]MBA9996936.1 nucleotide pyrophosphohydrolase [Burkholderia cepacia]MBB0004692.1 nucleotide pyrophosphohydrolase [Burkholderia cepacia]